MKKQDKIIASLMSLWCLIGAFAILTLPSCKSGQVITNPGTPEITWDGKTICIGMDYSVTADTTMLKQGITLGDEINFITVKYNNGKLTATGHGCYKLIK